MNKKFLSVALSVFMLVSMVDFSFAAKKDVADPVLQEIIAELSDRMPRFINKYGAAIFVADEQITRGALLQALYEFDKKSSSSSSAAVSSASSSGVISKKDYDALNAKVAALEKKVKSPYTIEYKENEGWFISDGKIGDEDFLEEPKYNNKYNSNKQNNNYYENYKK